MTCCFQHKLIQIKRLDAHSKIKIKDFKRLAWVAVNDSKC